MLLLARLPSLSKYRHRSVLVDLDVSRYHEPLGSEEPHLVLALTQTAQRDPFLPSHSVQLLHQVPLSHMETACYTCIYMKLHYKVQMGAATRLMTHSLASGRAIDDAPSEFRARLRSATRPLRR